MQFLQKMKPFLGWIPIILTVLIMLSIVIWINFRSYGMYYASKYYGRDNTYRICVESFKSGYNLHQKLEQKDMFLVRSEDKGEKIISLGDQLNEYYADINMDKRGGAPADRRLCFWGR